MNVEFSAGECHHRVGCAVCCGPKNNAERLLTVGTTRNDRRLSSFSSVKRAL